MRLKAVFVQLVPEIWPQKKIEIDFLLTNINYYHEKGGFVSIF
jgi:hypothetical protein